LNNPPVILVSGTSRGIGKYLAERYGGRGAVVIGCSRSAAPDQPVPYEHYRADVSSEADVNALFRYVRRTHGRLDVLINSAAVNPAIALSVLMPMTAVRQAVDINLIGVMMMCREAVKLMGRSRSGRIVNIGSMATRLEVAGESAYTATKAAVNAYTRVLAKEVFKMGITCNVVAPSAVATGLASHVDPRALRDALSRNAVPDLGTLDDISNAIDWLIMPESQAITGQIIYLGGA
jgi:3-oxoacyl-[acyl-carrier protein] reductase